MTFTLRAIEEKFRHGGADVLVVSGDFVGTYVEFDFKADEVRGQGRNGATLRLPLAKVSRIDVQLGSGYRESSDECFPTIVYSYRYLDGRGDALFVLRFEEDAWDRKSQHSLSLHNPLPGRMSAKAMAAKLGIEGLQDADHAEESWLGLICRLVRLFGPDRG